MVSNNEQLMEIGLWRLVAEIVRHYPNAFRIIEMHTNQGQSDCISMLDPVSNEERIVITHSSLRVHRGEFLTGYDLRRELFEGNTQKLHKEIFARLQLKYKKTLPLTTGQTLVYRLIGALLSPAAFAIEFWECRNGYEDSSGYGGCGPREKYFKEFPGAEKRAAVRLPDDLLKVPHYRFWFIVKAGKPICCFETTGSLWTLQGRHYNLMELYKKHRRLWPIIIQTIGDQLD